MIVQNDSATETLLDVLLFAFTIEMGGGGGGGGGGAILL